MIVITTFNGSFINTYYNLNDPSINDYPQLTQILSLIQYLMPILNEYHHSALGMPLSFPFQVSENVFAPKTQYINKHAFYFSDKVMEEAMTNMLLLSSYKITLQSFIFTDHDELHAINVNMSYHEICDHNGTFNASYLIHEYESLEQLNGNLFPVDTIKRNVNSSTIDPP